MTLTERIEARHQQRKNKQINKKDSKQVLWLQSAYASKRYTGIKVYSDGNKS